MKPQINGAEEIFSARQRLHLFVSRFCRAQLAPCCSLLHGTSCGCRKGFKSASIGQCSSGISHGVMIVLDWHIPL